MKDIFQCFLLFTAAADFCDNGILLGGKPCTRIQKFIILLCVDRRVKVALREKLCDLLSFLKVLLKPLFQSCKLIQVGSYDNAVKNKYSDTIRRMSEFIEWHIDLDRKEWLVKALLDVIENDAEIAETDSFYIKRNGCPVSKQDIRTMTDFELLVPIFQEFPEP